MTSAFETTHNHFLILFHFVCITNIHCLRIEVPEYWSIEHAMLPRSVQKFLALELLLCVALRCNTSAFAFSPAARLSASPRSQAFTSTLSSPIPVVCMSNSDSPEIKPYGNGEDDDYTLPIPYTFDEMVRQASTAMRDAYDAGLTRQVLRVLVPRVSSSAQLGQYYESDAVPTGSTQQQQQDQILLAPPDETWQGGIMQLYRAAAPTAQQILKTLSTSGGVPPRNMVEDRSMDESGVDGVGLWMTRAARPEDDVSCFVQPSQETIESIESISKQAGDNRLVALLNPQWRTVDDALDTASRQDTLFGTFASFLGGKGNSLRRLDELGFTNVYTLEGYVCKGGNVRLMKRFDQDWGVYAENDAATDYIKVGSSKERPTYQDVDKMLDNKGISLKYARDIGFAPKL